MTHLSPKKLAIRPDSAPENPIIFFPLINSKVASNETINKVEIPQKRNVKINFWFYFYLDISEYKNHLTRLSLCTSSLITLV